MKDCFVWVLRGARRKSNNGRAAALFPLKIKNNFISGPCNRSVLGEKKRVFLDWKFNSIIEGAFYHYPLKDQLKRELELIVD